MSDRKSILIAGASRGLGLGLAKEFAARGRRVVATERTKSDNLHALDGVEAETVDVTEPASYSGFGSSGQEFDAVFINAGISGARHQSSDQATGDEVAEVMMTNAYGPVRAGRALLPAIRKGGTLAFMSSLMGSISDSSGGFELYRASKAALNMLAKGLSEQEAKARDVAVLAMHPGWVKTDMGGSAAPLSVEESVAGLADIVEQSGGAGFRYVDYTGKDLAY